MLTHNTSFFPFSVFLLLKMCLLKYCCCCVFLFSEKPLQMDQLDRILLSGIYNVRKGKTQLHKWAERLVVLCGTCLIVSSVKDCQTGKMHILPLVGGKVRLTKMNYSSFDHLNFKKSYFFYSFFTSFNRKQYEHC